MPPKHKQSTATRAKAPTTTTSSPRASSPAHAAALPTPAEPVPAPTRPLTSSGLPAAAAQTEKLYAVAHSASAAAETQDLHAFYRTGHWAAPPATLMELLRTYVKFFLLCVRPCEPRRAPSGLAPGHAPAAPELNGSAGSGSAASRNGAPAAPPAGLATTTTTADLATQVAALLFVSVPHRVSAYLGGIELMSQVGPEVAVPVPGPRKRRRTSSVHRGRRGGAEERNGAPRAADAADTCEPAHDLRDEHHAVPVYDAAVMLRRLGEYGAAHLRPFDSDSAYLAAKDVLTYMRYYAYSAAGMALTAAVLRSVELAGLDFRQQCVPCMEAATQLIAAITEAQVRAMARPPRIVRLGERLRLSPKAARTLEFLLICHCGRYTPTQFTEPLRPANIAYHNELTPQELLSILSESGVLWKQGLVFSDIKMRATFMDCKYALPIEAVAALSGDQLSEEQLIKLERTALSEVLSEERHAASTSPATATAARASASPSPQRLHGNAGEERDEEGSGSYGTDDEEDGDTASTAGSVVTLTEELLEEALDHIDPATLATKDAAAIQEAVTRHLHKAPNTTSGAPSQTERTTLTTDSTAARGAPTYSEATATAVADTKSDPASTCEGAEVPRPPSQEPPPHSQQQQQQLSGVASPTSADVEAPPRQDTRLTLADINPLAQRHRSGPAHGGSASLAAAGGGSGGGGGSALGTESSLRGVPYESDIASMDASFRILANLIRVRYAEGDMKDEEDSYTPKSKVEASIRELKGKVRVAAAVHASRLQATLAANTFTPRIEQLAKRLGLTEMEKQIMLFMVGNVVSHDLLIAVNGRYVMRDGQRPITVGYVLFVLCESLEERVVARRAFYQSAPLITNGVLSLNMDCAGRTCFNTDMMEYLVDIDRQIVDDVMGIAGETAEMVPGSQLYLPSVELTNVMLPSATMDRVLSTIAHYDLFEQCKKRSGFGDGLGTSKGGLVMLFHGPSGTGKTMLANAVAHHLGKKILLVSVAQFRSSTKAESDALRFLFREAKLNDAIVFFDECESLFEDRASNATVTALLAEFERYDGLIVLATNRAQNFDEAMNRRISLMMEFRPPDHQLRLRIWQSHMPKQLARSDDVCLEKLALNYELSGGLIRNAVLAAISRAVAREKSATPTLTMSDLDEGARLQLRGFFLAAERPEGMSEFYVTPKRTLAELVLEPGLAKRLEGIASSAKSRSTLYTEWGFSEDANDDCGALFLFQGVSGTGKSLAAEGIAYECGATIRLCNVAELLLREEMRVHAVFEEGRRLGAIIVFEEAQVLFNESPKSLQLSQLIQYHARRYPRPVIVVATTTSRDGGGGRQLFSTTSINSRASCMLFQAELTFALPSRSLREQLWRKAFPERVPVAADVDFAELSATSISPKLIRSIAFNVCCAAALLPVAARTVTMAMIAAEVERTAVRERSAVSASAMFA